MVRRTRVLIRLPKDLLETSRGKAEQSGVPLSVYTAHALSAFNSRGSSDPRHSRELPALGFRPDMDPTTALDWLLAKNAQCADLMDAGGQMSPKIEKYIRKVLTETQARRLLAYLNGYTLEQIAESEPKTSGKTPIRQAIHKSVQQARASLRDDREFRKVLLAEVERLNGERSDDCQEAR